MTTKPKNKNSELVDLLRKNFDWQFARIKFIEKISYSSSSVSSASVSSINSYTAWHSSLSYSTSTRMDVIARKCASKSGKL